MIKEQFFFIYSYNLEVYIILRVDKHLIKSVTVDQNLLAFWYRLNCFRLFGIVLCPSLPLKCWNVSESWMSELAGLSDHILIKYWNWNSPEGERKNQFKEALLPKKINIVYKCQQPSSPLKKICPVWSDNMYRFRFHFDNLFCP